MSMQMFYSNGPIAVTREMVYHDDWEDHTGWSSELSFEIPVAASMLQQFMVEPSGSDVAIICSPTRLPRRAKKWKSRPTKRNERGRSMYQRIEKRNNKVLHNCDISLGEDGTGTITATISKDHLICK